MRSGIYKITNCVNKKGYVGQTIREIPDRWREHKYRLRGHYHDNEHLQRAWDKYGENAFIFEVLEYCAIEDLGRREGYWIKRFKTDEREFGYNDKPPTENGGYTHSTETRKKMSESMTGKRKSEEHIRNNSRGHAKPFKIVSPTGEIIEGRDLQAFCYEHGLLPSGMSPVVNGKRSHHKGWTKYD
jgi:group I intron endonuclease